MPEIAIKVKAALVWLTHPQTTIRVFNNDENGTKTSFKSAYNELKSELTGTIPNKPIVVFGVRSTKAPEVDLPIDFSTKEYIDLWKDATPPAQGQQSDLVRFIVKYIDPKEYSLVFTCEDPAFNRSDFIRVLKLMIEKKNMSGCVEILEAVPTSTSTLTKASAPVPVAIKPVAAKPVAKVESAAQFKPVKSGSSSASGTFVPKNGAPPVTGTKRAVEAMQLSKAAAAAPPGPKRQALVSEMKSRGFHFDMTWLSGIMTAAGLSAASAAAILVLL